MSYRKGPHTVNLNAEPPAMVYHGDGATPPDGDVVAEPSRILELGLEKHWSELSRWHRN